MLTSLICLIAMAPNESAPKTDTLVLAGGCFWCVEGVFEELEGVSSVVSGYAGGKGANPTYEAVTTGMTGHAEVVKLTFDPAVISKRDLLRIFFTVHNPTTLNKQGYDVGTQYRSAIFFANDAEKKLAQEVMAEVTKEKIWKDPLVTTLEPLTEFYVAEDYHQDYYKKFQSATPEQRAKMNAGYCNAVVVPKVLEFRRKFASRLKKSGGD